MKTISSRYEEPIRRNLSFNDERAIDHMLETDLPEHQKEFLTFVKDRKLVSGRSLKEARKILLQKGGTEEQLKQVIQLELSIDSLKRERQRELDEKAKDIMSKYGILRKLRKPSLSRYDRERRDLYDFDASNR